MSEEQPKLLIAKEDNPMDLDNLRLPQDFHEMVGVQKIIQTISVRKPHRLEFVRVHPEFSFETMLFEIREENESFLVNPALWSTLSGELVPKVLYPYLNKQSVLRLWPIRLHDENGRLDAWNQSALKAAETAKEKWIRVASNRSLGAYEIYFPQGQVDDPDWPELSMQKMVNVAFEGRFIDSMEHYAVRDLGIK